MRCPMEGTPAGQRRKKARGNLWWLLLLLIALTCGRIAWNARKKKNKHDE